MSDHEKEPWQAMPGWVADSRQGRPWDIVNANGGDSIATTTLLENDEANARRIVACVNACVGASTDDLEKHGFLALRDKQVSDLERQRDELRAALELMLNPTGLERDRIAVARSAIANLKP